MLRQFSGLCLAVGNGFGLLEIFVHERVALGLTLAGFGTVIGIVGLVRPALVRWIFVTWMIVAFPIGWAVSHLLLAITFYGLFLPIGIVFRLMGRDPLTLRPRRDQPTCWVPKPTPQDVGRYFRQF
jgi:hypothetical protein